MQITGINHLNIVTEDLQASVAFYTEVLGLVHGPSLRGGEEGAYLYTELEQPPLIHMIDAARVNTEAKAFHMHAKPARHVEGRVSTGPIDHIAFSLPMAAFETFQRRLDSHNVEYTIGLDFMPRMKQIWAFDPNGIKAELNFA